jgi:transposase
MEITTVGLDIAKRAFQLHGVDAAGKAVLRREAKRKGLDGLSSLVQERLAQDPFCGHLFVFRGRRGDLLKVLWYLCLFAKRLEKGRFVWPSPADGKVVISPAQLGMLLEGIDWRMPRRKWRPELAG